MVCTQVGIVADLEEITKLAETDERGATMAGLQKAARSKGLQAVGLKIGLSELAQCAEPAICHLWGDHFVVAQADGAGAINVTDPSAKEGNQRLPFDDFRAAYSGFALLISRQPITPPGIDVAVPDLRFDAYSCDLGSLDEGVQVERIVTFRNAGERDLTVSRVRPTCTCIQVEDFTKTVPPGRTGSIAFTYDTKGMRGAQMRGLYIESNDPVSPLVQIEVGVLVRPGTLLVSTRRVDLGTVDYEKGAARELYIKDPGDGSLDIRDVRSDSQLLEVTFAGAAPPEGKDRVFPLRVSLKPGSPVGPFRGSITVDSNHPKEPMLTIPVTARIKGDIEIHPETLFLGFVQRAQPASGSVTLLPASARGFSITDVRVSSDLFTATASPAYSGKGYEVIVAVSDAAPAGLLKAELIVRTSSSLQPTITLPISAYVENRDARKAVVRLYVFTSQGCHDCMLVDSEHLQALAARVNCRLEAKHFDVADPANWRKLSDLEQKHGDLSNAIPVVFVGAEVLGGEQEVAEMLEPIVATYATEGGTTWPDETDHGSQDRD
jgi:hypothetical protein